MQNIVKKGETACNKQFLLFSQCFLPYMALILNFNCTLKMSSAICFNLDQSKILSHGNGLIHHYSAKLWTCPYRRNLHTTVYVFEMSMLVSKLVGNIIFSTMFLKLPFSGLLKLVIVW